MILCDEFLQGTMYAFCQTKYENTVAYIQIPKKHLNIINILSKVTEIKKSKFLPSHPTDKIIFPVKYIGG